LLIEKHEKFESDVDHAVNMVGHHLTNIGKILLDGLALNSIMTSHVAENEK
jgi:hypothetical protein